MSRYPKREHSGDRQIKTPENIVRDSTKERIAMFFCLIPVFGLIPSAITLVRQRSSRKAVEVSKVSIALVLGWAIAYGVMGGVPTDGESIQVTTELVKASLSSGYFAMCMYLMYRLHRNKDISLPSIKKDST